MITVKLLRDLFLYSFLCACLVGATNAGSVWDWCDTDACNVEDDPGMNQEECVLRGGCNAIWGWCTNVECNYFVDPSHEIDCWCTTP